MKLQGFTDTEERDKLGKNANPCAFISLLSPAIRVHSYVQNCNREKELFVVRQPGKVVELRR